MFAGIAWHPDPAQSSESVQLVTASADKTARFFSGEGKQLGTLEVSQRCSLFSLNLFIMAISSVSSSSCTCNQSPTRRGLAVALLAGLFAMLEFLWCVLVVLIS